jgi:hypothetical protein
MDNIRKIPTEKEMIDQLRRGNVSLPPLAIRFLEEQPNTLDAYVEASRRKNTSRFAIECKSISTPRAFRDGLNLLRSMSLPKGYRPMLVMPFFSDLQLQELEREGISGIDPCGNGVVIVPGMFSVFRNGAKNRFSSSAPIKNIYRKNSSMVGRVFLTLSRYGTVQEICSEINRRNMLVNRWNRRPLTVRA